MTIHADDGQVVSLRVYVAAVALTAALVAGAVLGGIVGGPGVQIDVTVLVLVAGAALSQFFPVRMQRKDGNEDLDAGHAFILAILLVAGPATAVVAQIVTELFINVVRRRAVIKAVFNVAQTTMATAAASATFAALVAVPAMGRGDGFGLAETAAFLLAAAVYQTINETSVLVACALADKRPLVAFLRKEFRSTRFHAAVSLMAPLTAAATLAAPWLVPALVVPVWALRRATKTALETFEQSRHDNLTGLPSALALREALAETLARRPVAVAMLDLDGFKDINDTLGHQAGDVLLRAVAERLARETAGRGRVYRLQGDEFVAMLDADGVEDALLYAGDVTQAFARPFAAGDLELDIGLSVGIARVDRGECSTDELLRRADAALKEAKDNRVGFALHRPGRDTGERARQVIAADLRRALCAGEVEVHYQPQFSLRTGDVESVEALVRWRRGGELVPPAMFIPQAEHTRVMLPLTLHVLRTALADCRRWVDDHGYAGSVAINVSARTLHHPSLVSDVRAAIEDSGMDAHRLELEITESALMVDPDGARRTLAELHALGVSILIDDFGTGYSSLAYLGTLPVDGVKVDRSFVAGMASQHADLVIVRATLDLGHNLGLRTIAEGVEDTATRDALVAMGCDLAQGWLWHPALPADALGEVLAAPARLRLAA